MKKLVSNLMNIVAIVISVLTYIFLSQAHLTMTVDSVLGSASESAANGYDIIQNFVDASDSKEVMVAVSLIFVTIFAAFIILCATINLLANFGIIKSAKISRMSNFVNIASAVIMFVFCAIGMFIMVDLCKTGVEFTGFSAKATVGWAFILNFILALGAVLATIFASLTSKGKKRK